MDTILRNRRIGNLPVGEITASLGMFLKPVLAHLPEKRLREVEGRSESFAAPSLAWVRLRDNPP